MYLVVHHKVSDRDTFFASDPRDLAANAPPGVDLFHFLPAKDASAADCLWEADSPEALRNYLDSATSGIAENTYFEVDSVSAMGIPEAAVTRT
jgi:hypothetical protein